MTVADAIVPLPGVILLDLNMPRKDGREVVRELRVDASLRYIPVVVLTTSKDEGDIGHLPGLVEVMNAPGRYWFQVVELPDAPAEASGQ